MHPTVTPFSRPCAVSDAALESYRKQLAPHDYEGRNGVTIGVLTHLVEQMLTEQDPTQFKAHLENASAVLIARFQLVEEELGRYFYDRDDVQEANPDKCPGVEVWAVGRRSR